MLPVLSVHDPDWGDGWNGSVRSNLPISYMSSVGTGGRQTLVNDLESGDFAYKQSECTSEFNIPVYCDCDGTKADADAEMVGYNDMFVV